MTSLSLGPIQVNVDDTIGSRTKRSIEGPIATMPSTSQLEPSTLSPVSRIKRHFSFETIKDRLLYHFPTGNSGQGKGGNVSLFWEARVFRHRRHVLTARTLNQLTQEKKEKTAQTYGKRN